MRRVSMVLVPLLIGAIGFMEVSRNPRFQAFHTVDIMQLLGCGMCLGIAIMAMFGRLKARHPSLSAERSAAERS